MKSLFNFIVSTKDRYNNKIDVNGNELIVNTEITERDYHFVNRIGTVVSTPLVGETEIKKGDEVILHHNVFRRWYDQRGRGKNGKSYLSENLYAVEQDQIFAYKRNGKWYPTDGYCFVSPIEVKDEWKMQVELPLKGVTVIGPKNLVGHIVGFTPGSEYEFNIDGLKLYRILSNKLTIDYGCEETKKTDYQLEPQSA